MHSWRHRSIHCLLCPALGTPVGCRHLSCVLLPFKEVRRSLHLSGLAKVLQLTHPAPPCVHSKDREDRASKYPVALSSHPHPPKFHSFLCHVHLPYESSLRRVLYTRTYQHTPDCTVRCRGWQDGGGPWRDADRPLCPSILLTLRMGGGVSQSSHMSVELEMPTATRFPASCS